MSGIGVGRKHVLLRAARYVPMSRGALLLALLATRDVHILLVASNVTGWAVGLGDRDVVSASLPDDYSDLSARISKALREVRLTRLAPSDHHSGP